MLVYHPKHAVVYLHWLSLTSKLQVAWVGLHAEHACQFALKILSPIVPLVMVTDGIKLFPYVQVHHLKIWPGFVGLFNVKDAVSIVYQVLLGIDTVQPLRLYVIV